MVVDAMAGSTISAMAGSTIDIHDYNDELRDVANQHIGPKGFSPGLISTAIGIHENSLRRFLSGKGPMRPANGQRLAYILGCSLRLVADPVSA